ncbi:hypothetical protein [Dyadobacter chenhuakuii]|uniref:Uncharacterized protein n=1 Tax=Dyadobacter chenhuakuii TaxID=2909339 RepID=A0ABY4XLV2_9BACT|nr:hypothetical protein [Dyadobacter chenhuakuii]MCF2494296.1 hypothetical protein [Dyadobacter chenhuakuii]USJ31420.1 hypothetical protein NFI80_01500 [Dyadobacter chenhuakuii]
MNNAAQNRKKIEEALNAGLGAQMNSLLVEYGLPEFAFESLKIENSDKQKRGDSDSSILIGCRWVYDANTGWFICV